MPTLPKRNKNDYRLSSKYALLRNLLSKSGSVRNKNGFRFVKKRAYLKNVKFKTDGRC